MANARSRWSYAEDRRLMKLAASGKSLEAIAELLKRPPATVRKMALRLSVSAKAKPKG